MRTARLTNIRWDTDGEDVDLPSTLVISVPKADADDDEDAFGDLAVDAASDHTGWCISGCDVDEVFSADAPSPS